MVELGAAVLIVLTIVGSGVAVLPWTTRELESSARAWRTLGVAAVGLLARPVLRLGPARWHPGLMRVIGA